MEKQRMNNFTDARFMTAKEKELVLRNWNTFLKNGLKEEGFAKRLYNHLHLHCGFIAHYNLHGFYSTYFETGVDVKRFFELFCSNISGFCGGGDYRDLNTALVIAYQNFKRKIQVEAERDINKHLDIFEASLKRARSDKKFAEELLCRIRR